MEQRIEIANGHGNSAERIERRRSTRGHARPRPRAHRIGEASSAAYMPFGRIAEPRKRPHHRRTHFAAAAEPAASRPHALNGASLLFRNGATRNERMERTSRGPACGEPCLAPGGMPRAARRRRDGRAMRFWPAVTARAATRLAAALRRCMHARARRPGLDCNVRQRKKPARRGPVPRIATTRCTTFEARLVGAETAVSKHRSGRLGDRKWRTGKFDALPNSGQSPRRAKIAVQSSERRGPPLTRFEFNAQCHCAISVKYENNGDTRHECRANLRSRPRTEAPLAIPLPPPLRQASKLREPAWQAVEERLFGENSGISFMPATVRRDSIAARMRKLSRKCRLHGFAVHVRWLFPPPGWPIRTDKWRYHALSARRRFSGIAVEHALAARIECETARRKRRGDTRHAPPKVSVFGSQGEAIRDWVSSFGEIARLPRQNRKRRSKWMRRRETFGSIRQVRIDGRIARHPPERIGFIAESTHNPLRREIAGPP
ncbi:hypothetical protein [Burkholderia mallei]|uniref:hypothetical protein n=1 Tax=Burkholderia mallei TaxID=13373 RepID=UPI001F47375C|nr:hypothetical protein [Burkholderia mallei]